MTLQQIPYDVQTVYNLKTQCLVTIFGGVKCDPVHVLLSVFATTTKLFTSQREPFSILSGFTNCDQDNT